jgi:hypothetical protein
MSEYLSIYLLPKKSKEGEKKEPMYVASYSRNSDVFQAITDEVCTPFGGEDYTELTTDDMNRVCKAQADEITEQDERITTRREALRSVTNSDVAEGILCELDNLTKYRDELQGALDELRHIQWLTECAYDKYFAPDFEGVVMNRA